ncbi:BREX-1 system phosphatase PglZ type A [Lachnospiraceae bacterium YH-ros2226]
MAELNLKQIEDRLNAEFLSGSEDIRKLVFWYDDKAEFAEDVDSLRLSSAKILHLTESNQFKTKLFLEQEDRTTNYLIYAPFSKPDVHENHLEDVLLYSKRFFADRASLLVADLGISESLKPLLEKHISFFANKERTKKFYDLGISFYDERHILLGMMCVLSGVKTCSFEEVLRIILSGEDIDHSQIVETFRHYELEDEFWKMSLDEFGSSVHDPSISKLVISLFVTCADHEITEDIPEAWKPFLLSKTGNAVAFLDSMMNSVVYQNTFDNLSRFVSVQLHVKDALRKAAPENLTECECFADIDGILLHWITGRLLAEDLGAHLVQYDIPSLCELRVKTHFGRKSQNDYEMLISAFHIESSFTETIPDGFKNIINAYQDHLYKIDHDYRRFYYCLDQLEDAEPYEKLRILIENIYTNEFLGKLLPEWNSEIMEKDALFALPLQRNFYIKYVSGSKDRVVVIISDAMRYEVGRELFDKLADNPRSQVKIEPMLSTLPSYTRLGMSAMLPHRKLELSEDGKELVNGIYCIDLASREKVLQARQPLSRCVQFDEIKNKSTKDLREIFTGQQVIYVYHNQIDVRGEHTEDEVFLACEEAVKEITAFIEKIHNGVNTHHFIVTADHGFIYKRDKVQESDKIGNVSHNEIVKRRYIISYNGVQEDGVCNLNLGHLLGNDDSRMVSFPIGTSVFKTQGSGGQNYVHGGSSPEEMLVPVIDVRMERGKAETRSAQIMLVSIISKITSLITTLDFIQSEAVSDVVRAASYQICFVDEVGNLISNENIYVADSREEDSAKRIFRLRFTFKNQEYDKDKSYYLIGKDENTGVEVFRHQVIMDLPFAGDFGFNL